MMKIISINSRNQITFLIISTSFFINIINGTFFYEEDKSDPCYDYDNPQKVGFGYSWAKTCVPSFVNAAFGKNISATSQCGDPPTRFCRNEISDQKLTRICSVCDVRNPNSNHPPNFITDLHNPRNPTCWTSEIFKNEPTKPFKVNLTVSFQKSFEITYISLEFCTIRPDSLVIYKSSNDGKTWMPFQYYSSNCEEVYGVVPQIVKPGLPGIRNIANDNQVQKAFCSEAMNHADQIADKRIIFSTLSRRAGYTLDDNKYLQDWVTATDIRIELTRLMDNKVFGQDHAFYSMSDIVIGGRCKCNGHASKCVANERGELMCECRHNTAGKDCERCLDFYADKPWQRGTPEKANECEACNCNLHARKCKFDPELYKLSGHGGVCIDCIHNTDGRYCHLCKQDFYRNQQKPITHRDACIPCKCHPVGARGKTCDQATGQCQCKEGVIGQTCNRCDKGYQQSRSSVAPCIKVPNDEPAAVKRRNYPGKKEVRKTCANYRMNRCIAWSKKLNQKKYCRREFAIVADIGPKIDLHDYTRFSIEIKAIFKKPFRNPSLIKLGSGSLWVPTNDLKCNCPNIRSGKTYLLLGHNNKDGKLRVDKRSLVIRWREDWTRRIRKLQRNENKGKCPRKKGKGRRADDALNTIRKRNKNRHRRYFHLYGMNYDFNNK